MGKLRRLSGRETCAILTTHGFQQVRRHGSHVLMQKRIEGRTLTVPVPSHKELASGTLAAIIRQSGVARAQFEEQ